MNLIDYNMFKKKRKGHMNSLFKIFSAAVLGLNFFKSETNFSCI